MIERTPFVRIWKELAAEKSMVFMAGPRQCGKTTLANMIEASFSNRLYFNWDVPTEKRKLLQDPFFFEQIVRKDESMPFIVLDEIHKYKDWKNYLKGVYDRFHQDYTFLVLGSGRLDMYQRGGDSLAGRYYLFHLWPLTLAELGKRRTSLARFLGNPLQVSTSHAEEMKSIWEQLSQFSGFPEPYLAGKPTTYRRWSATYHRRLIREDIRDLTDIRSVEDVEALFYLLPSRIGAPLSISSLARDLKVAYNTVRNWLSIFERFYLCFSISPWTSRISRAIQKEKKTYLLDYALIEDQSARFENMVAVELLRAVSAWTEIGLGDYSLHFVRDKEKREVDFLIADRHKPVLLVETKLSDETLSPSLIRFQRILKIPAVQLLHDAAGYRLVRNGEQRLIIAPASMWLPLLP